MSLHGSSSVQCGPQGQGQGQGDSTVVPPPATPPFLLFLFLFRMKLGTLKRQVMQDRRSLFLISLSSQTQAHRGYFLLSCF